MKENVSLSAFSDFRTNHRMSKKVNCTLIFSLHFTTTPEAKAELQNLSQLTQSAEDNFFSIPSLDANQAISNKNESFFRKQHSVKYDHQFIIDQLLNPCTQLLHAMKMLTHFQFHNANASTASNCFLKGKRKSKTFGSMRMERCTRSTENTFFRYFLCCN